MNENNQDDSKNDNNNNNNSNNNIFNDHIPKNNDMPSYSSFPFELDDFQRETVQYIQREENVLVSAPTGSGKTFCATYAISQYITRYPNKRVIYTSPIKSLSNQKRNEFSKKFKGIAHVGIATGDIKYSLDSQILVMTAEILRNLLHKNDKITKLDLKFDLDKDVSCVIMDEAHYIGDFSRGNIWEETLILLNKNIKLLLLSATLGNGESVRDWLTCIKNIPCHLVLKKNRVIPLIHQMYHHFSANQFNLMN